MVKVIEGNLFDTKAGIICHQCNCQGATIAFPYLMSCHRGGGDWNVVSKMIEETFQDYDVEIWRLNN